MIDLRKIYFPQKPTSSHLNYQLSIINSKSSSVQSVQIRVQKNIFRVQISPRRIPPIHHQIAARHPSRGIAQEIAASIGNVIRVTKVKQIQGAVSISHTPGSSYPPLGWVRGPRPTWRGSARFVRLVR